MRPRGYAELCDHLRARVARGELAPGARLPTVRALACELGVNPNTVGRAYSTLAREGVLTTQTGAGTRVAQRPETHLYQEARVARLRELLGSAVLHALGLGYRPEQIEAAVSVQLARWQTSRREAEEPRAAAELTLTFAGSHDLTIDLLAARLQRRDPPVWLHASYEGSLAGLTAVARGEAHLAGCHLLDEESGEYNLPFVARMLAPRSAVLVMVASREQGLIVAADDPKRVHRIEDLARPDVVLAARQSGSGTHALLQHELRRRGIAFEQIRTDGRTYTTHLAVASAVADGAADCGLGVRAAALAYGLAFHPVAVEPYELVVPRESLDEPGVVALLEMLSDESFRRTIGELGGYTVSSTGQRRESAPHQVESRTRYGRGSERSERVARDG
ncbi:MAG: GntR family transcriptional regulator [Chloroflexi bacterium]|nr:GntR family transcriptional regulator [Chloroflexota bacterium]